MSHSYMKMLYSIGRHLIAISSRARPLKDPSVHRLAQECSYARSADWTSPIAVQGFLTAHQDGQDAGHGQDK